MSDMYIKVDINNHDSKAISLIFFFFFFPNIQYIRSYIWLTNSIELHISLIFPPSVLYISGGTIDCLFFTFG